MYITREQPNIEPVTQIPSDDLNDYGARLNGILVYEYNS